VGPTNVCRAAAWAITKGPIVKERRTVSILWIILIVIVVLALLGFFSRGRF